MAQIISPIRRGLECVGALRDLNELFKSFQIKVSRGVSPKSLGCNSFTANFSYRNAPKILNEFV